MAHQVTTLTLKGKRKEHTDDLSKFNITIPQVEKKRVDARNQAEKMMEKIYKEMSPGNYVQYCLDTWT